MDRILDIPTLRWNLTRVLDSPELTLPDSYLVIDTETTDTDPADGRIWQIGLYPVINGQPTCGPEGESIYVAYETNVLKKATFEIERRLAASTCQATDTDMDAVTREKYYKMEAQFIDEVQSLGKNPKQAFEYAMDVITMFNDNGWPIVGQNFVKFDVPFLTNAAQYHSIPFQFPRQKLLDTGMLIKAARLGKRMGFNEACRDFYVRIAEIRAKGVYYAIEKFCFPYWNLEQYGFDIHKAHGAGYDAAVTAKILHCLVNEVFDSETVKS